MERKKLAHVKRRQPTKKKVSKAVKNTEKIKGVKSKVVSKASSSDIKGARIAEEIVRKKAKKLEIDLKEEYKKKKKCIKFEEEKRREDLKESELTTPCLTRRNISKELSEKPSFDLGVRVKVSEDLSVGKCSHGGLGWVIGVNGIGGNTECDVRYDYCASGCQSLIEKNVNIQRMTEMPSPFEHSPKRIRNSKRNTFLKEDDAPKNAHVNNESGIWIKLENGYKSNRKTGWLANDNGLVKGSNEFNNELVADYKQLSGYLCGLKECGREINMMRDKDRRGRYKRRKNKYTPISLNYLQVVGYGVTKKTCTKVY